MSDETIFVGVMSANKLNWDCVDNEICPTCEESLEEISNLQNCPECKGILDEENCTECEWNKYDECGNIECFDHSKLIGDWKKDENGLYEPNENGEFAAILTSSTFNCVQVLWSKYTASGKRFCSPCFPNQADIDTEYGNLTCYVLPDYMIYKEEE